MLGGAPTAHEVLSELDSQSPVTRQSGSWFRICVGTPTTDGDAMLGKLFFRIYSREPIGPFRAGVNGFRCVLFGQG
jgi:hypothetical protein